MQEMLAAHATPRPSFLSRLWRGLVAVFSGQAISIFGNLAVVPVYLTYWSAARYGEWLALSAVVAYLSAFDFGMNAAGGNKLIQEYARGDLQSYQRYQRSALAFYMLVAALGSVILAGLAFSLPLSQWLGFKLASRREVAVSVFLLGLQVLWSMPAGFVIGTYRTIGNLARSLWISNLQNLGALTLSLVCLSIGGGMIAIAGIQLACVLVAPLAVLPFLKRSHPDVTPQLSGAELSCVRELVRPSAYYSLIILSEAIRLQGTVLLVSARLGPVAVAVFASSRTLCNAARQCTGMIKNVVWPHVTALEAQARHAQIRLFHRLWVLSTTGLLLSFAATLWFEGSEVMRTWTRGRLPTDMVLLRLLLAQLVLQSPWIASSLITVASSRHMKLAHAYIWSSLLSIGIAAVLINRLGIWALPVGGIVGEALVCYHFVTYDTCRLIGERYLTFALRQWLYVASATALALLAAWSAHSLVFGPAVLRWALVGAVTAATVSLASWTIGLRAVDKIQLKSMLGLARS